MYIGNSLLNCKNPHFVFISGGKNAKCFRKQTIHCGLVVVEEGCVVCVARAAMANFKVGNFPRENQY